MGHCEIENETPFSFQALAVADEEGRPVLVCVVKGTFDIAGGEAVSLAEEQLPVALTVQSHGEPGASSSRLDSDTAFVKPATDVVLLGHAYGGARGAVVTDIDFRVGPVARQLRVTGDRLWVRRAAGSIVPTAPNAFDKIPLLYERAFGGWDRSPVDPRHHSFHPENPVGVGFRTKHARFEEGAPLPNIEDPRSPLASYAGPCRPAGVGFLNPEWEPRRSFAGTYDKAWSRTRMPLLPTDFDRRYFNAASPGLVVAGYLRGDEPAMVRGACPAGVLSFRLPGVQAPTCRVACRDREDALVQTRLDTVIVDADAAKLVLVWRGLTLLRGGAHDAKRVHISSPNAPARREQSPPNTVVRLADRTAA